MPLIPVPALKAKFALLRSYSPRTDWASLAEPFGAKAKTLQYWCDGSGSRSPDQMPPAALPVLIGLFAELLPDAPVDEVRRLVLGPLPDLEAELRAGTSASFAGLLSREGLTGTGVLIRKSAESGLIEIESEPAALDLAHVPLGAWFRVAFPFNPACHYALTLQGVQQVWAAVPFALSNDRPRRVLLPGLSDDGEPRFMRERRDAGLHRFVCLQAAVPFPAAARLHLRDGILFDRRGLDALAGFYAEQPPPQRACHVLTVLIEPDSVT